MPAGDHYWYETDGLDSIVALAGESGALATPYLYDKYGQLLAGTTDLQRFTYTAQDYDPETGLLHFYARYYDPARGVWLTQDPWRGDVRRPATLHRYGYVENNSLVTPDIYGYCGGLCIAAIVFAVVTVSTLLNPEPVYAPAPDDQPGNIKELVQNYEQEHKRKKNSLINKWVFPYVDISDDMRKCGEGSIAACAGYLFNVAITTFITKGIGSGLANVTKRCLSSTVVEIAGLTTKNAAREELSRLAITEAQRAAARRAISRATTKSTIDLVLKKDGNLIVRIVRPGEDGYQVIESIIQSDGTKQVIQKAFDAMGKLVHYHPKGGK